MPSGTCSRFTITCFEALNFARLLRRVRRWRSAIAGVTARGSEPEPQAGAGGHSTPSVRAGIRNSNLVRLPASPQPWIVGQGAASNGLVAAGTEQQPSPDA